MYKQVVVYLVVDGNSDVFEVVESARTAAAAVEGVVEVLDFSATQDIRKETDDIDECYVLD